MKMLTPQVIGKRICVWYPPFSQYDKGLLVWKEDGDETWGAVVRCMQHDAK